jgi:hypothetical protein
VFWFWIFVGPALSLAILSLRGERKRAEYITSRMAELDEPPSRPLPPVTVVVQATTPAETRATLAEQHYPDYEVVATRESARPGSQILAFAPSSGFVSKSWLLALVLPLLEPGVAASIGFRWYAPDPPTFWSLMRSAWNGVISNILVPDARGVSWPAAQAIGISYGLSHPNGAGRVAFAPGAMAVDISRPTFRQFLNQARREMSAARRLAADLWWQALLAHIIYCGAMLAAIIASARGNRGAEWALVVQFGLGMLKGANRATFAKAVLPEYKTWFDRYSWTHILWVPLATWVWLFVLMLSVFGEPRQR